MAKQKIFLLDAFALLYRSHFAFIKNPRLTSKGVNTSAIFGFTNSIMEIIGKENPDHLAVVFDTKVPTFRHEMYKEYKAHREQMPEDLRTMVPYAYKMLEALNIAVLFKDGFEADDVIGTISDKADPEKYEVYMVTPDKDYAQLVKENVFLYKPRFRGGGYDVMGPAEVETKFGLPPEKIADFLGLKGDASDNIPGVPRVGDKTAVSLLLEFGSVENIIENADNITKKSIQKSVKEFGEQGLLSKELATIHLDVPVKWSYDQLKMGHLNFDKLMPLMQELEFKGLSNRILASKLNPVQTGQLDLFGGSQASTATTPQWESDIKNIDSVDHKYDVLDNSEKRLSLIKKILKCGYVCFDTETTSLNVMQAEVVGLSFSIKSHEASYVFCPEDQAETKQIIEEFKEVLEDEKILKIGQNLKYDMLVLRKYDIDVKGPMFDTMLAHYVLQPHGKHGMDAQAIELLGYECISIKTLLGSKKAGKAPTMREADPEKVAIYAAEDADITFQLYEKLKSKVKGDKIFEDIEMLAMPALADMEYEGINLDKKALEDYSVELGQRIRSLKTDIFEGAEEEFNINSPKQLGVILFEKMELGKGQKAKKTKTGQYQTNEQILSDLAVIHEFPAKILAYRSLAKLKSTYVDALPALVDPDTGRIHTTFSQSVAVTGRLASTNPNLQNIPIRTADGREVRKGFIPRDKNHTLLSADYSQVELRVMASMSGDEQMIEAFQKGEDIHRATAARVFGVSQEEVTSDQRSHAKMVNFGIIYGISVFGLSQRMGIPRTEAKEIIDTYFETYPDVKSHMDASIESAKKTGYSETIFGRRRYLADINSKNATVRKFAERNAINSPIQGSAADIVKLAMIKVADEMSKRNLRSRMLLQVHDELIFDVLLEELDEMKALVKDCMENAAELKVPLIVDMGSGANWLEAH